MRNIFINMGLLILLFNKPLYAQEALAPLSAKLYYEASFSGVNFGKIGIEIDQQEDKATVTCDISSSGILALFLKHSSHTTLAASGANFSYPERVYESNYQTRNKLRRVKLTYTGNKISEQIIVPPDNRDNRPAVPEADINKAYDLMTFLLQLRTEISKAKKDGKTSFTLNTYDGRRLTQADFTVIGQKTIKIGDKKYITLAVSARRKFLAGYSKGEMEDYKPDEPSMTIYFSNDERLIPLRMEVPFLLQYIRGDLIKECTSEETCLLGNSN